MGKQKTLVPLAARLTLPAMLALSGVACQEGAPDQRSDPRDDRQVFRTIDGIDVYKDLVYKEVEDTEIALDVYSEDGASRPGLLLIHGGGWSLGDKDDSTAGAVRLAQAGFSVVVIDYRLSPPGGEWHAPAAVEDARDALLWVRENGERYGIDADRIAAVGPSAGGHLAMMLAVTGEAGRDKVEAAVSFSGPSDLTGDFSEPGFDEEDRGDIVENFMACTPDQCAALYRSMSPIEHVDASDAPIYQAVSTEELLPEVQARRMARALDAAGVPNVLEVVPGSRHGRLLFQLFAQDALAFLGSHLETST